MRGLRLKQCPRCGSKVELIRPMGERLKTRVPPFYGVQSFRYCCSNRDCITMTGCHPTQILAAMDWNEQPGAARAEIKTMKLSGNREEHYVRVVCGDRSIDIQRFLGRRYNRALYTRDELNHVLQGTPKPRLLDEKYADREEVDQ